MRRTIERAGVLVIAAAVALAGCARTNVKQVQRTDYDPSDPTAELDFWHNLPGRSAVTNDEGLHGVLVFADGTDPTRTYADRVALLKERGWLPAGFDEEPNVAMQRGTLAKALAHALEIRGGVMMRVTDKSRRYSNRELVYMGLMAPGTEQQVMSGLDYIGVISKAQDYQTARSMSTEAPSQPIEDDAPSQPVGQ